MLAKGLRFSHAYQYQEEDHKEKKYLKDDSLFLHIILSLILVGMRTSFRKPNFFLNSTSLLVYA